MAEQAAHNRLVEGSNPSGPICLLMIFIDRGFPYRADLQALQSSLAGGLHC